MSAIAAHIKAARERGPKAGLKLYLAASSPLARERQEDILAADDRLVRYCEIFGDQIGLNGSASATAARVRHDRNNVPEGDEDDSNTLDRLLRRLGYVKADEVPGASIQVVADTPAPKPAQTRKAKATASPVAKGDTVLYTTADGKRTIEYLVVGFGESKQGHPGTNLRNTRTGREKVWTNKSILRHIENDSIVVL